MNQDDFNKAMGHERKSIVDIVLEILHGIIFVTGCITLLWLLIK